VMKVFTALVRAMSVFQWTIVPWVTVFHTAAFAGV
jgi:hypothetical protein